MEHVIESLEKVCGLNRTMPSRGCTGIETLESVDPQRVLRRRELPPERSQGARRRIASLNCIDRDRPDVSMATCVLSQQVFEPSREREAEMQRVIQYLQPHPDVAMKFSSKRDDGA